MQFDLQLHVDLNVFDRSNVGIFRNQASQAQNERITGKNKLRQNCKI